MSRASIRSSGFACCGSYFTAARSARRLTVASSTPGTRLSAPSTRDTQAAQCIPFTVRSHRSSAMLLFLLSGVISSPPIRKNPMRTSLCELIDQVHHLLIGLLRFRLIPASQGVRDAVLQVISHQKFADTTQRLMDRGDLIHHVHTIGVFLDQPLEALDLAFDAV